MIMFHLHRTLISSVDQTSSPGQPGFSEEHRNRWTSGAPAFRGFVESLEPAVHAIPGWRYSDDELADGWAHAIFCEGKYWKEHQ
jgi:hypothetical protein